MRYSYSNVDTFDQCPFKWFLRYVKGIRFDAELKADNPLLIGTLLHDSIEFGLKKAEKMYYDKFPIIQNEHVEEIIKISHFYDDIMNTLPKGINELKIETEDFLGYVDLVTENEDGTFDIYDFKYSNNVDVYMNKMQLHIYKYYIEKETDMKIKNLKYLFVPKTKLKKKFEQTTEEFRLILQSELDTMNIQVINVEFDSEKVDRYFNIIKKIEAEETKLTKNIGQMCYWCDYENICINSKIKA